MPSIFSADWRNELNAELAEKQPLLGPTSSITIAQATIGGGVYGNYSGAPISTLVPGSTFGSLIEGASAGHLVLGIRDNEALDSVSIVSYNATGNYSRRVASFKGDGLIQIFGQIQFPATQRASADPNTLDDYEEGTWTPTISFGGASVGVTYGSRTATYTKVGRLVQAQFDMVVANKGTSTGNAELAGWPFASLHLYAAGVAPHYSAMSGIVGGVNFIMGASSAALRHNNAPTTVTNLNDANFTNGSRLIGTMTYPTT